MGIALQSNCPVPFDQEPLNEYLALKQSWLFSWSTHKVKKYIISIFSIFSFIFVVNGLFVSSIYNQVTNIYKLIILNCLICDIILFLLFIRLYLGWSYIMKRLLSATIFYEESGWYDGQVWIKTSDYLMKDRLVGLYQIMPLINRLKCTFVITAFAFLCEYLVYNFL